MVDPNFPALHIRPEHGWVNDPNGVSRIDGTYHVFFQYNPDAPTHGNIHWGHVSSPDLLRWREHPIALFPRPGALDAGGCWSGCITDDDGVPTAVYTANPDHAWNGVAALARSDRSLDTWQQPDAGVMSAPAIPEVTEVRDPFVFSFDGHRYVIQGAGRPDGRPRILLYRCDDLAAWEELGVLIDGSDERAMEIAPANIWECPNLIRVGDRWVLVLSMWRLVDGEYSLAGVRSLIGDLVPRDPDGMRFVVEAGAALDSGPTFYAPQILAGDRPLLWGWAWELNRSAEQIEAAGWAGALTFPRELTLLDGVLGTRPAAELTALRGDSLDLAQPIAGPAFEIVAEGGVRLFLARPDGEDLVVEVTGSAADPARILVDGSLVEAYAGPIPHTTRAYPEGGAHWRVEADRVATGYVLALPRAD